MGVPDRNLASAVQSGNNNAFPTWWVVGYEGRNKYRIWFPDTGKVIRARDVVFDEGVELIDTQTPISAESGNDQREVTSETIQLDESDEAMGQTPKDRR